MDCDAERKFENPSVTTEANSFVYLVLHDVKGGKDIHFAVSHD